MKHKLIYETIVGSTVYGTATPDSDVDKKGVYTQTLDELLTWDYEPHFNVTKDESYYEVKRFIELLEAANPTALEMLFTPDEFVTHTSPEFELIRNNKFKFLTKKCAQSFANYGYSQISKATGLDKKMNWEKNRITKKTPLDFIYYVDGIKSMPIKELLLKNKLDFKKCGLTKIKHMPNYFALYYDFNNFGYRGIITDKSNELRLSSIPKGQEHLLLIYYNAAAYSIHCKEYKEYKEWLKNRNTTRYVDNIKHNQMIDGKNLLHCRRLIDIAIDIAKTGNIIVKRPNAEYLLSIKRGEVSLKNIIADANANILLLDELYKNSNLPNTCDKEFTKDLLLQIRYINKNEK